MVLAHWGNNYSEERLARFLGTQRFGTPFSNVIRLQHWGYQVDFGMLTAKALKECLLQEQPVIVQVWPVMLPYWPFQPIGSHVVVVVGSDNKHVYVNDPVLAKPAQPILWDSFLAA
jgi:ABC-type bacteriocin/lantibiotic exporter with double-glycine peptidase domain